jgi:hypothetical protein
MRGLIRSIGSLLHVQPVPVRELGAPHLEPGSDPAARMPRRQYRPAACRGRSNRRKAARLAKARR